MDPTKITAAPWNVVSKDGQAGLHDLMPDRYPADAVTIERQPQSKREAMETFFHTVLSGWITREDAEFIAMARNAFAGDPEALAWWEANRVHPQEVQP